MSGTMYDIARSYLLAFMCQQPSKRRLEKKLVNLLVETVGMVILT